MLRQKVDNESDNSFQVDQVEISWLFNFDAVTAQIDLEYEDGDDGDMMTALSRPS